MSDFAANIRKESMTVKRSISGKIIYSYLGILAGGAAVYALLTLFPLVLGKGLLTPAGVLQLFVPITALITAFLAVSNVSLLRHEGRSLRNLLGTAWGLSWVIGNLLCLLLWRGSLPPLLRRFAALLGCYGDLFLSGVLLCAFLAARHKPAYDKDFVIIPGCSISKKGGLLPLLKGRTNRAIRFAWDQEIATGKPVHYIPTGGQGPDEIMSEGSAMEFYLLTHGAEQYEILPEKASVNTYENMLFARRLIDEAQPGAKVCVATTNYHVLRSVMLARKAGLDAEGLASTTKWYFWPNGLAREIIAIVSLYPIRQLIAVGLCLLAAWLA